MNSQEERKEHEAGKGENQKKWTAELKTDVSDQEKSVKKITSPNSGSVIRAGERESEEPADTAPEKNSEGEEPADTAPEKNSEDGSRATVNTGDDNGMPKKQFGAKSKFDLVVSDAESSGGKKAQNDKKNLFGSKLRSGEKRRFGNEW